MGKRRRDSPPNGLGVSRAQRLIHTHNQRSTYFVRFGFKICDCVSYKTFIFTVFRYDDLCESGKTKMMANSTADPRGGREERWGKSEGDASCLTMISMGPHRPFDWWAFDFGAAKDSMGGPRRGGET